MQYLPIGNPFLQARSYREKHFSQLSLSMPAMLVFSDNSLKKPPVQCIQFPPEYCTDLLHIPDIELIFSNPSKREHRPPMHTVHSLHRPQWLQETSEMQPQIQIPDWPEDAFSQDVHAAPFPPDTLTVPMRLPRLPSEMSS